jgi:hypothetical protein
VKWVWPKAEDEGDLDVSGLYQGVLTKTVPTSLLDQACRLQAVSHFWEKVVCQGLYQPCPSVLLLHLTSLYSTAAAHIAGLSLRGPGLLRFQLDADGQMWCLISRAQCGFAKSVKGHLSF